MLGTHLISGCYPLQESAAEDQEESSLGQFELLSYLYLVLHKTPNLFLSVSLLYSTSQRRVLVAKVLHFLLSAMPKQVIRKNSPLLYSVQWNR